MHAFSAAALAGTWGLLFFAGLAMAASVSEHRQRKKVLFFGEAVTLAHIARPGVLAQSLLGTEFEPVVACDPRYAGLFPELERFRVDLQSIPSALFLERLAEGQPLYDEKTLTRYVEDDLRLLSREDPDVVVGDFRLSLSISARKFGVPYLALSNAYWSPYADIPYPIPEHRLVSALGLPLAQKMFDLVRPIAFAFHAKPLNRVRKRYGMPALGSCLQRVYTDADHVLYADIPQLVRMRPLPSNHHFIGPVLWSPSAELPSWWNDLDHSNDFVYVTLGSSGRTDLLTDVLRALSELPVQLIVSTAGRTELPAFGSNVHVCDYIPGDKVTAMSRLVVCNGGSLTCYQALASGVPVLGIPGNLDQHLNMSAVERLGAGLSVRTDGVTADSVRHAVTKILTDDAYRVRSSRVGEWVAEFPAPVVFRNLLREVLSAANSPVAAH